MSEPFLGEITMFGGNFAPRGYAFCDGQLLAISQNQSLFSLLGTTYGGDGRTTFALPDLRGRAALHFGTLAGGSNYSLGQRGGTETNTLTNAQMPSHSHQAAATDVAPATMPAANTVLTATTGRRSPTPYSSAGGRVDLAANVLGPTGSGAAHNNMQPFTAINFCIAVQGLFPSRS